MSDIEALAQRLEALAIMDEVRSDNPLGREAAAALRRLDAENFALAADQCEAGYGDEWGNHQCGKVDALLKEAEHLAGAANDANARVAALEAALRRIANGVEDGESFSGTTCAEIARAALEGKV